MKLSFGTSSLREKSYVTSELSDVNERSSHEMGIALYLI